MKRLGAKWSVEVEGELVSMEEWLSTGEPRVVAKGIKMTEEKEEGGIEALQSMMNSTEANNLMRDFIQEIATAEGAWASGAKGILAKVKELEGKPGRSAAAKEVLYWPSKQEHPDPVGRAIEPSTALDPLTPYELDLLDEAIGPIDCTRVELNEPDEPDDPIGPVEHSVLTYIQKNQGKLSPGQLEVDLADSEGGRYTRIMMHRLLARGHIKLDANFRLQLVLDRHKSGNEEL